jgi:transitional endoplasmic reticulum ATPase
MNRRTALVLILVIYAIVCSVLWFGGPLKPTVAQIPASTNTVRIEGPGGTETVIHTFEGSTHLQFEQGQVVLIASIAGSALLLLIYVYEPTLLIPASTPGAYDEVGGLNDVKAALAETIELPLQRPDLFKKYRVVPPTKGLLLYGPPGCGKTLLARSIAAKGKIEFVYCRATDIFTKYYGESASRVRELFSEARRKEGRKEGRKAPCVLFFDEIDALVPIRGMADQGTEREDIRVTSEFLAQLDGLTPLERVIVVGATNRPEAIDPAMLRPGRFDKILYVPPPDIDGRIAILTRNMQGAPMADDVSLDDIAVQTEGYSGADIVALCREAKMFAIKAEVGGAARPLSKTDFDRAINLVKPSIDKSVVARYELFARDFRKSRSS